MQSKDCDDANSSKTYKSYCLSPTPVYARSSIAFYMWCKTKTRYVLMRLLKRRYLCDCSSRDLSHSYWVSFEAITEVRWRLNLRTLTSNSRKMRWIFSEKIILWNCFLTLSLFSLHASTCKSLKVVLDTCTFLTTLLNFFLFRLTTINQSTSFRYKVRQKKQHTNQLSVLRANQLSSLCMSLETV